jgi:hypothetical protein
MYSSCAKFVAEMGPKSPFAGIEAQLPAGKCVSHFQYVKVFFSTTPSFLGNFMRRY